MTNEIYDKIGIPNFWENQRSENETEREKRVDSHSQKRIRNPRNIAHGVYNGHECHGHRENSYYQ